MEARTKGERIGGRGDYAAVDGGHGNTPSTSRGHTLLAGVQSLASDDPKQERHPVLSKVGSPSYRLTVVVVVVLCSSH